MKTIFQNATLLAAIAVLHGCGSSSSSSSNDADKITTLNPEKVFNCTPVSASPRTICIGSEDDLSDTRIQTDLLSTIAVIENNDTIVLPAGRYLMTEEVSMNGNQSASSAQEGMATGVTFKGAGMKNTILDFSNANNDGFFIENTKNLTFEDLGVFEAANNAIKIIDTDGIIIRRTATVWETDYQASNGAYGIYPVETQNVLIEDCWVKGSADAGVYVGQSQNIVVRGCLAEKNVAGIEIENSINADVYGNTATGNTGGLLVFDLPIPDNTLYSKNIRLFDNMVTDNNAPNFANTSSSAAGVHIVPPGTGIILLSTDDVEIFNNTIRDHNTMSIAITSFLLPDDDIANYPNRYGAILMSGWMPLVKGIHIHDNSISQSNYEPAGKLMTDIIAGYNASNSQVPNILYDGIGELLANAGQLEAMGVALGEALQNANPEYDGSPLPGYTAYSYVNADNNPSDAICIHDNGAATMGAVYLTNPMDPDAFDLTGNAPTPKLALQSDAPEMFACGGESGKATPTQPSPAVVTIDGNAYGCGVDDNNTSSDFCIAP